MIILLLIWKGKTKMYFINIKQLKQDIINKEFSEKDRFIYIIAYTILGELSFLAFIENSTAPMITDYISGIGTIIITAIGTYYLYLANEGSKGEDFLGRYFSIVWVVIIRLLYPYLFLSTVILIIMGTGFDVDSNILEITMMIFSLLYGFFIYYCSYGHMVEVSKKVGV